MFDTLLQKIVSLLLSLTATLWAVSGVQWADRMEGHELPLIAAEEKAEGQVRVASLNVRSTDVNGVPRFARQNLVVRALKELQPDSFGLQEATPVWMGALRALLPEYGCVGVARDNGLAVGGIGEACPVFYLKSAYTLLDHGDFWLSDTPEKPSYGPGAGCRRVCTWALLQNNETHAVYLHVNTHFDNASEEARQAAAKQICDFLQGYAGIPVVFTADLNTSQRGEAYKTLTGLLADTRAAEDSVYCATYHNCAESESAFSTLDHILVSRDITANAFRVVTAGIDGRFVSDHFPLYADITVPPLRDSFAGHAFPLIEPAEKAEGATRVMSFNLRCTDVNGVPADYRGEIVAEQIRAVQPDSVGTQEATAWWVKTLAKRLPEYAWVGLERENGKPADQGGEACPIFYLRAKFRLVDHGDFWISDTPDEPSFGPGAACKRICTWAVLRNRLTGEEYVHVNTHFDHISEEARLLGGKIVNDYVCAHFAGKNVVFTADMNTTPDTETYAAMTASLADTRLTAQEALPYGTFHACIPETHADYYIDFVLCSPGLSVRAYRTVTAGVQGRFVSDHFPIYADIDLGGRKPLF